MSIATIILGESGTGKSASMRNLDPEKTLLIQSVRKTLPFRGRAWSELSKENPTGCVFASDNSETIIKAMSRTKRKVIVIDDFQYVLANEFMRRSDEKGFEKFTDIGRHAWDILTAATKLPDDTRVYILSHIQTDEAGRSRIKTIGKLLDEKITIEGMVTIVLRTVVDGDNYQFATRNSGNDTTKSPMGMFESDRIPNDISAVDDAITSYYELPVAA